MDLKIIDAVKSHSNSYSFELWSRFLDNQISDNEKEIFTAIQEWMSRQELSSTAAPEKDLFSFLGEYSFDSLPSSFFRPGSTADIFINCHTPFMNHVIHSHDFFEMIYVCKGEVLDWVDGTEIWLGEGELCIHNPNAMHKIEKMTEEDDVILNILLPPDMFQRSFYSMLIENKELDQFFNSFMISSDSCSNFMVFHDTSPRVDTIIELLAEEFLRGENVSRFVLESTLVVLFGELLRNYKPNPFSQKLIAFITDHLEDISMESAAQEFGYHKNYFPNVVKEQTSHTFWELVTEIRLQKAVNLLLFTNHPIDEITDLIGYKSTASFYGQFKKAHHMTPNQYRKEHAVNERKQG